MSNEVISDKQGISLVTLFILGSTLVIGIGTEAGRDSYFAVILGLVFSLPMIIIYARILSLYRGNDLFDILEIVFGKLFGKIMSILYIWFPFHLGSLIIRDFGEFITTVSAIETPMVVFMSAMIFLCVWAVKKGCKLLGRWAELGVIAIIFFVFFTIILSIPNMQLNNIKPVFYKGMKPVLGGAFSVFSFPFAETVIFCLVFSNLKTNKSPYKIYKMGLLIGGFVLFSLIFSEILILGEFGYVAHYFPAHIMASRISIGDAIQRMEILVAITFLGSGFIKICVCLFGTCKGVVKMFNFDDYSFIVTPVAIMMLCYAFIVHDSIMEIGEWAFKIWRYYALVFEIIFPVIIWIGVEIKKKRSLTNK
ncbi:GerAB/ArcD/ProY family transporter [Oceanirhabdus seepicola]|uniref:Endospore germination permease n=1 Tax=Oceanirhabdus seepicola TaxID=2828781 RepID=A0A9J6P595_9CLOT|nr:endospore germination permease [Oceanirhabdus seepicola]MCM1991420.1 endospore germination permease [Oceanirhabdus seepicola]